ncbi:cyclic diguanylate phosphodiesterase [Vibrio navarrensis]|uniref:cyclic-guanylate-specific phosphodiesterase n=1 Tax=Vibrio navarrensis TaxID=29495 RepID=A0AAI9CUK9_9VIBR|nr:cyclic diguanylate phosphodiesterase [Vibrio navarrensis]
MINKGQVKPIQFIFLTVIPCFLIIQLSHFYFVRLHKEKSQEYAQKIVLEIESILNYGKEANQKILSIVSNGESCDDVIIELRKIVATTPFVRTTNLAHYNKIYCTSLWGERSFVDTPQAYVSGELLLMKGSKVESQHPLVVVRTTQDNKVSLSGIDGLHIRHALNQSSAEALSMFLKIGDAWLDEQGRMTQQDPTKGLIIFQNTQSNQFPFAIQSGFSYPSTWNAFWHERKFYILLILFMQGSFSLCYWWLANRPKTLDAELQRAIRQHEFVPYAQPIVNAETKEITGIEILMRWQHPIQGLVRPDLFIPQAEESGLIIPMTQLLFKETARQLREYRDVLPNEFHVGINISPQHCKNDELFTECQAFYNLVDCDKTILVLELTEREVLEFSDATDVLFRNIKQLGCKIAIDDFGTGHSSLINLQKIDLDYLKIDQIFIKNIGADPVAEHLVESTIELAKRLSLNLIAEGVECEEQVEYLRHHDVNYLQGFLFAKPVPLSEFLQQLQRSSTESLGTK